MNFSRCWMSRQSTINIFINTYAEQYYVTYKPFAFYKNFVEVARKVETIMKFWYQKRIIVDLLLYPNG